MAFKGRTELNRARGRYRARWRDSITEILQHHSEDTGKARNRTLYSWQPTPVKEIVARALTLRHNRYRAQSHCKWSDGISDATDTTTYELTIDQQCQEMFLINWFWKAK